MRTDFTPKQLRVFWSRVLKGPGPSDCWIWIGRTDRNGYGRFSGRISKEPFQYFAHRVMWCLIHGVVIESSEFVLHRCDHPYCVNPDHLFLGTQRDNIEDMIKKGRDKCLTKAEGKPRGHKRPDFTAALTGSNHFRAKLTESDIPVIRARRSNGESLQAIANDFGITFSNVCSICKRKTWTHVE